MCVYVLKDYSDHWRSDRDRDAVELFCSVCTGEPLLPLLLNGFFITVRGIITKGDDVNASRSLIGAN